MKKPNLFILLFSIIASLCIVSGFKPISIEKVDAACKLCKGTGKCSICKGLGKMKCTECDGTGKTIGYITNSSGDNVKTTITCKKFGGKGKINCISCNGSGVCAGCNGTGKAPY
jgi:hypothetical protein